MAHRVPDFIMTVLACWLGLSLWVRAPRDRTALTFAWFCFNLAVYGLTGVLALLTTRLEAAQLLDRVQMVATLTTPAAFLQFVIALVSTAEEPREQRAAVLASYALGLALCAVVLFGPLDSSNYRNYLQPGQTPFRPWAPWGQARFTSWWLNGLWAAQRVLPLLFGLYLMARAYGQRAGAAADTRQQRRFFAIAATIGVLGAVEATLARTLQLSPAPGRLLIATGLGALAYAVLAYRSLLPPRVAQRAFVYSLLGGLITIAYIALLLALEWLARWQLGINTPIVTVIALIALVALFGPLRDWLGAELDRRFFRNEFDFNRLLGALSSDLLGSGGTLEEQTEPLLAHVCRAAGARAGVVAVQQDEALRVVAGFGDDHPRQLAHEPAPSPDADQNLPWPAWPDAELALPLTQNGVTLGALALGARQNGRPYGAHEQDLLRVVARYLAVAVAHQRVREQEQHAVMLLTEQGRALREQQAALSQMAQAALDQVSRAAQLVAEERSDGLRVACLGPLHVERDGAAVTRWGGEKAGTKQAEALFALLFDRRGRGVTKDEAEAIIWPELEIEKADTAFHRTLSALRRTLEPDLRRGNESKLVPFARDRYWLAPQAIAWSDADEIEALVGRGRELLHQGQLEAAREPLEQAAALYRGPYMDDCPFFGDSAEVEERRTQLHNVYVECLLTLGEIYEQQGRAVESLAHYRRALAASDGEETRAEAAIARLRA